MCVYIGVYILVCCVGEERGIMIPFRGGFMRLLFTDVHVQVEFMCVYV